MTVSSANAILTLQEDFTLTAVTPLGSELELDGQRQQQTHGGDFQDR